MRHNIFLIIHLLLDETIKTSVANTNHRKEIIARLRDARRVSRLPILIKFE